MSRQYINGCIQRRETGLPCHLWKSPVITHKVNHFLLEIFAKILHAVGTLGKTGGGDHVIANTGGIVFVVVGKTPVRGEFVCRGLFGDSDFGRGHQWEEEGGCRRGRGSLEELTTSGLFILQRGGDDIMRISLLIKDTNFFDMGIVIFSVTELFPFVE